MATTSVINSTKVGIYYAGTLIAYTTDASITISHEVRDITSKDSGGWRELLEGLRSWSMSASAFYSVDGGVAFDDVFADLNTRTAVTVKFASSTVGDKLYQGSAYCTSANVNSPGSEDNAAFDVTFEGTSTLTEGTTT